ncbi:Ankyrin repeat-containing protein [Hibiscus syriacus]|uniref:Ankyrin repeat-containing protein n=1 Tax=Hibiscus syriacus TaxID=106335 RepID=A0A6A3BRG8_HIBSY|nr:Ankyrin repeat-containing protein [Hibiscus syriacus]
MCKECEKDLEKGLPSHPALLPETTLPTSPTSRPALFLSNSGKALLASNSSKSLVSSSSKSLTSGCSSRFRFDKKYLKQVTGRHNDTELHLAAQRGDVAAIRQILADIDAQMIGTISAQEFNAEVEEIKLAIASEVNELGETALFVAAEKGYIDIVKELLQYSTKEGLSMKNQFGFNPLHIAANRGHEAIVQVLLDCDPELCKTVGQGNATPLVSAATKGHTAVVDVLLSKDPSLLEITKSNGKNPLHFAARQGHVDIVRALLEKGPQLARQIDKKEQTALHMAVKGVSCTVVKLLLMADSSVVTLPDKFGNTPLHIATRKKRTEIVNELLHIPETCVNALTRDHKTALDIAEGLPLSEEIAEIKECLSSFGAVRATDLNNAPDELRKTMKEIKKEVHTQLEQTLKTNRNVDGIVLELIKLHQQGIYNATNSITVVAVLFATVAFTAIFTVPGGDNDDGIAVASRGKSFKIFCLFNAIALFTSLAVVVVQITVVRGELNTEKRFIQVINKLMWLASICTSISFVASAHIVVGRRQQWAAILVMVIGGVTMAGVLGGMTLLVLKNKRIRKRRKREKKQAGSLSLSDSDTEVGAIYAI